MTRFDADSTYTIDNKCPHVECWYSKKGSPVVWEEVYSDGVVLWIRDSQPLELIYRGKNWDHKTALLPIKPLNDIKVMTMWRQGDNYPFIGATARHIDHLPCPLGMSRAELIARCPICGARPTDGIHPYGQVVHYRYAVYLNLPGYVHDYRENIGLCGSWEPACQAAYQYLSSMPKKPRRLFCLDYQKSTFSLVTTPREEQIELPLFSTSTVAI